MITRNDFSSIDTEVQESLNEALDFIKAHSLDHDYILYLADGEFDKNLKNPFSRLNPYTIDNRGDKYKDESRLRFFSSFMQHFYSFPRRITRTNDNEYKLTMELMIYTHIWESTPFLKQLYRLALLVDGKGYYWSVNVPEMTKHNFIRKEIRDTFINSVIKLAEVISKGFHTSLRNAFAHSEYRFDDANRIIHLDNFKGSGWEIERISYDDWTKRFVYSALLAYHLLNKRFQRRRSLTQDFGTDSFLIIHPITETRFRVATIYYNNEWDRFSFYDH